MKRFNPTTPMILHADCLDAMKAIPANSVDLVMCSPPYEAARTYGIGFKLRGQEWVDWMFERVVEMVRICKGLVAIVCEGQTRQFRYSATPFLLMADLHRAGYCLRKTPVFHRISIPGSGGPDWLRNDWEPIVCVTKGGKLPWSDNTAMGSPSRFPPGGAMSYRNADGVRKNMRGYSGANHGMNGHGAPGAKGGLKTNRRVMTRSPRGSRDNGAYNIPAIANPGNVIHCKVGGGAMGSSLSSENEAPYPERLAEFFIRSFCPPGGIVLDPFSGSGTTAAVATKWGRDFIAIDVRESQTELTARRLAEKPKQAKPRKQPPPHPRQSTLFAR